MQAVGEVGSGDFYGNFVDAFVGEAPVVMGVGIDGEGEAVEGGEVFGVEVDDVDGAAGPEEEAPGARAIEDDSGEGEGDLVAEPIADGEFFEADAGEDDAVVGGFGFLGGEPEVGVGVEDGGGGVGDDDGGFIGFVVAFGFYADAVDDGSIGAAFVVDFGFKAGDARVFEGDDVHVAAGDDVGGVERQGEGGDANCWDEVS